MGDPLKYESPSAIVAFAGLNPMVHQSGEKVGQTTMLHLVYGVVKSDKPFDPQIALAV
ncbi:transposase [Enterobacterales bacterium AW_CKDN230030176-1A_HGKHYDSX7]